MNKLVDRYMDTLREEGFDPQPEPEIDRDHLFKPLNPELEYVDVTDYELEMAHQVQKLGERVTMLEQQLQQAVLNTLKMAEHIRDLHAKVTGPQQSAIILPDRFN